ncbi:hypothetical protein C8R47DRAFT_138351 [Mycena vitilis]|nr:hypothetical protein C8R47DRAFT_138351 [Mycena vitilis]
MASQNGRQGNGSGYNRDEDADPICMGDLVIVEADRGKDLGKVVNDSITLSEVEAFWSGQQRFGTGQSPPTSPGGPDGGAAKKKIVPKMIHGKAGAGDAQLLVAKMQDEVKALQLCQTKVRAKKLPMEVVSVVRLVSFSAFSSGPFFINRRSSSLSLHYPPSPSPSPSLAQSKAIVPPRARYAISLDEMRWKSGGFSHLISSHLLLFMCSRHDRAEDEMRVAVSPAGRARQRSMA